MYDTLVLSGNNTNAIVILGALQYLKDNKLFENIDNYVDTSSGYAMALLLFLNYTPLDILTDMFDFLCRQKHMSKYFL